MRFKMLSLYVFENDDAVADIVGAVNHQDEGDARKNPRNSKQGNRDVLCSNRFHFSLPSLSRGESQRGSRQFWFGHVAGRCALAGCQECPHFLHRHTGNSIASFFSVFSMMPSMITPM